MTILRSYLMKVLVLLHSIWFFAHPLQAFDATVGTVLQCVTPRTKPGQICIVKTPNIRKGSKVVIYTPHHYWVATGTIIKARGQYGIATFRNSKSVVQRGFLVETGAVNQQALEWTFAFTD